MTHYKRRLDDARRLPGVRYVIVARRSFRLFFLKLDHTRRVNIEHYTQRSLAIIYHNYCLTINI